MSEPQSKTAPDETMPSGRWDTPLFILLALSCFSLYSITAAPTAYWLDSSEFAAAGFELGIPHPPGHPLFVLLAKLATLIPFGTIAFRVHILCAATLSTALAIGGWVALRLWGRGALVAILATIPAAATSMPFWFHGVRAEVYSLHLLLASAIVAQTVVLITKPRLAHFGILGFVTGLSLANHHYLTAFMAPGVLLLLLTAKRSRKMFARGLVPACIGVLVGVLPYLLVPLRSGTLPTVRWGQGHTAEGFFWILSGRPFQKTAGRAGDVDPVEMTISVFEYLLQHLDFILFSLAVLGLFFLFLKRSRLAIGLTLLIGANLLTQILFDFDPTNPDVGGYFLLSFWLLAILAAGPLTLGQRAASKYLPHTRFLAVVFVVGIGVSATFGQLGANAERCDLSSFRDTDEFADEMYRSTPTSGLMVTAYFETIFNLWYRDVAECRRPDVPVIHRLFRTYPGYDSYLTDRFPDLSAMLQPAPETGQLSTPWLIDQTRTRPVLFEVDITIGDDVQYHLFPVGLLTIMTGDELPIGPFSEFVREGRQQFWTGFYDRVDTTVVETGGNLLWMHFNFARLFAEQGRYAVALQELEWAEQIAPGDPDLAAFRQALTEPR